MLKIKLGCSKFGSEVQISFVKLAKIILKIQASSAMSRHFEVSKLSTFNILMSLIVNNFDFRFMGSNARALVILKH